jgi:integrase
MLVRLVGVHKVKATLSDGTKVEYFYAWRGGPRIQAKPGTLAFSAEFHKRLREREKLPANAAGSLSELIAAYTKSAAYLHRKASTRKSYDWAIARIEDKYGSAPLATISAKGSRKTILRWRDETLGQTPRAADLIIAVFSTILNFAKDREDIERNPLEGVGRLSDGSRRDKVWSEDQLADFRAKAPARMALAMELALWTGQRQGDLLRLTWGAYDGQYLTLKQEKTGSSVRVKVAEKLRTLLDAQKRTAVTILTNRAGLPYRSGFGSSWGKAMDTAGIEGVTFHDLRGTFITNAYANGASIKEIAEVSGHGEKEAERVIRKHYLRTDGAVTKLELGNKRRRKV